MIPPRRKPLPWMKFPKTGEAREALIDKTLKDFLNACPVIDRNNKAAVANMRESLAAFSSSKLMWLQFSANQDAPPDEETVNLMVKRMRLTHDGLVEFEGDRTFQWFRNWLRRGVIEAQIELDALEVVKHAVSRRDANGKPMLDSASREMSLAVLEHSGWTKTKPAESTVNVNNFITQPSQDDEEKRAKFDKLAKLAAENEEAAAIIAAMKGKKKPSPLAVGENGEIKEGESG